MVRPSGRLLCGDVIEVLRTLPDASVQCCVTSPPYWGLRTYGVEGQIGQEPTPDQYVAKMIAVFREVRRVLRDDGTLWLNLGDTYSSGNRATYRSGASSNKGHDVQNDQPRPRTPLCLKPKDLCGMPWRLAFALQADGWYLRQDIIWAKPNPMPESVRDRCTKAHEYLFLLTKQPRYYYDAESLRELMTSDGKGGLWGEDRSPGAMPNEYHVGAHGKAPWTGQRKVNPGGRNRRSVWTIATQPYPEAHFATFPEKLVEPCILGGTSERGCCPRCGAAWRRQTETTRHATRPGRSGKTVDARGGANGNDASAVTGNRDPGRHVSHTQTTGWLPSCNCCDCGGWGCPACDPEQVMPCTVLDPFIGSGTTAAVACRLGRGWIGI